MERQQETKRSINSKKAAAILAKNGVLLDEKKVEEILDVMYFLAKLIVNQNFKK